MEDGDLKVKKKTKSGPLKSSPGFLKCMRNVYLYFKEEKEKGTLNLPVSSFIERTAVACGVGRNTLYNYAKKGLFDDDPTILQPKKKKKRGKPKVKSHASDEAHLLRRSQRKRSSPVAANAGPSSSPVLCENESPPQRMAKNAMIQTDINPIVTNENLCMQASTGETDNGFNNFMISRDQSKGQPVPVVQQTKIAGSWISGTHGNIKQEVQFFAKSNIGHAVYSMHTSDCFKVESQTCGNDLNGAKITTCQQQTASDHMTDL